jgi:hypothetical protein
MVEEAYNLFWEIIASPKVGLFRGALIIKLGCKWYKLVLRNP